MELANTDLNATVQPRVGTGVLWNLAGQSVHGIGVHAHRFIETIEVFVETGLQVLRTRSRP